MDYIKEILTKCHRYQAFKKTEEGKDKIIYFFGDYKIDVLKKETEKIKENFENLHAIYKISFIENNLEYGYGFIIEENNYFYDVFIKLDNFYKKLNRPFMLKEVEQMGEIFKIKNGMFISKENLFLKMKNVKGFKESLEETKKIVFKENNCKLKNIFINNI